MKKNKRKIRRQKRLWEMGRKKQKFFPLFLRTWIPFMVTTIVICILGTMVAKSIYADKSEDEFQEVVNGLGNGLEEAYQWWKDTAYEVDKEKEGMDEENGFTNMEETASQESAGRNLDLLREYSNAEWEDLLKTRLNWNLRSVDGIVTDAAAALYNPEDHTLYCDNENSIFLIKRRTDEDDTSLIYRCDQNAFGDAFTRAMEYNDREADSDEMLYWFVPREIYVKGGSFLPGKTDVIKMSSYEGDEVIESYDLTPEDVSGYRYFQTDYEKVEADYMYPCYVGVDKNGDTWKDIEAMTKEDTGRSSEIWTKHSFQTTSSFDNGSFMLFQSKRLKLSDDFEQQLFVGLQFNMFDEYDNWIYGSYAVLCLLALLISLVVSYRNYMVYQAQYQMDTYRRETTNAMAHDLKSPLTAVSGFAENLKNNVHTEKREYYADAILDNVQYMNQLIDHILDLSKTETVENTKPVNVDLEELIKNQLEKQETAIEKRGLQVNLSGSGSLLTQEISMSQIIDNLISNAVKYTRENGSISIQIQDKCLEIENDMDGNLGIAVDELWKPFVKGDNSRSGKLGTGIGLTIVKNLTEVLGYELELLETEDSFVARVRW